MSKFRAYEFERDAKGMPTKMIWIGDYDVPASKSKADKDADKLREYQRVYGVRES